MLYHSGLSSRAWAAITAVSDPPIISASRAIRTKIPPRLCAMGLAFARRDRACNAENLRGGEGQGREQGAFAAIRVGVPAQG